MANFTRIGYGQVEPNHISGIKAGKVYASLKLDPTVAVLQNGEFMYYSQADGMVTADPTVEMAEPFLVYNEVKLYEDYLGYKDFAMIRVGDNYVTQRPAVGTITTANADGSVYGGGALTVGADTTSAPTWAQTEVWNGGYVDADGNEINSGYRMDGIAPRLIGTTVGDTYTTNMVTVGVDYAELAAAHKTLKLKKVEHENPVDGSKYNTLVLDADGDIDGVEFSIVRVYTMPDGQPGLKIQRIK